MCSSFQKELENAQKLDAVQLKQTEKVSAEKSDNIALEGDKLVCLFLIISNASMN